MVQGIILRSIPQNSKLNGSQQMPASMLLATNSSIISDTVTFTSNKSVIMGSLKKAVEDKNKWVLKTNDKTYLLQNVDKKYSKLLQEGFSVRVEGKPDPETVTYQMQGIPFIVEKISPIKY